MTDLGTAAKLRAAFELSPTILAVSDLETGRLVEVNAAFLRITGWTRDEIIGRPIPEIGGLETLRAGGTIRDVEASFRTRDGEEIVAIANADLVVVEGRPCVITALTDITARKQLERAKDEFLAMLGHELRNPLGTITNTLAVLNRRVDDDELRHLTAIIGRQTAHLGRLVDDLLDLARVTSGTIELRVPAVEAGSAPARATEPTAAAARRRRVLIVEDNADARESLQVLLRLAGHEVEAAEDGPSGLKKVETFRPDVALIDLGLPGMDGYDLVRALRKLPQTQATRFIALTAYGQTADRRRALAAGFDVHLTKPVDPESLQRLLAAG